MNNTPEYNPFLNVALGVVFLHLMNMALGGVGVIAGMVLVVGAYVEAGMTRGDFDNDPFA